MEDMFWKVHHGLPREGPGNEESTRKALEKVDLTAEEPQILDIGCGPGTQTITIAKYFKEATVTAVDTHVPFLDQLVIKADREKLLDRIEPLAMSMMELKFKDASFDLIWAEGSIYIMRFEKGLRAWNRYLRPGGYLAVTELAWLTRNPPEKVRSFWEEANPGMTYWEDLKPVVAQAGYTLVDAFILPEEAWWDNYYLPMEARIAELREAYKDDEEAQSYLANEYTEIDMYREFSGTYSYVFYIMRKDGQAEVQE